MATITLDPFIGDDTDEAGMVCILVNGQDVERFTAAEARALAAALVHTADEAEAVRGCSCGMADYGTPGHDGATV